MFLGSRERLVRHRNCGLHIGSITRYNFKHAFDCQPATPMSETRQPYGPMRGRLDVMELDFERCYRAAESRDQRFDGRFYTAVKTTGIFCRPSCPARTPKRANVTFFASAAAAQRAGFRACRRCRPDASPGSPEWDLRADVVGGPCG
jgi:AraC family transcriptional regulator of adaptative response / DNA-3-methyladenine glycosylase II